MLILRWILYFSVTIAAILAALVTITNPKYHGKVKIRSKYGKVSIYRGNDGTPKIFGENKEATYFGLGYVQAQDRLWQFEKFRRLSRGSLSEVFGDEAFPIDYFFKQLNFDYLSQVAIKDVDPEVLEDISYVAEGINEYIKTNPLPLEFWVLGVDCAPFSTVEILEIEKFIDFVVSYNHQMELTRDYVFKATNSSEISRKYMPFENQYFRKNQYATFDDEHLKKIGLFEQDGLKKAAKNFKPRHTKYPFSKKDIYMEVKDTLGLMHFDGSNAWVIHGNYTESGKPILSTDPHLTSLLPCFWMMAEVSYGNVSRSGAFLTGFPWILLGRTESLGIGITAIHADVIDLYEEKVSEDGKYYEVDGELVPIKQQKDYIKVRDPFYPSGYRLEEILINSTHHGPLINDPYDEVYKFMKRLPFGSLSKHNLAVSWSGFQGKSTYFSNNRCLNYAKDVHQGFECLKNLGTQVVNIFLTDTKGNIGMAPSISYPIRKHPLAGAYIQDGSKSENDWKGYVPFEEIPKAINPARGYITNSNNMLTTQNVEYGIGALMPSPPRVQRSSQLIEEQMKSGKKFTAKDMLRFQLDSVDLNAIEIHGLLIQILDKYSEKLLHQLPNQEFKDIFIKFKSHIDKFDGDYHVNSTQASLFALWELDYHISFLQDQIPQRVLRETMVNIPDGDLFLLDVLENLVSDPGYYSEFCQSSITIYDKDYEIKENKCLLSLAYNAIHAWKMLETTVSKDPQEWLWGRVHRQFYEHLPFSQIPGFKSIWHREVPAAGSRRTLSFACYDYFENNMNSDVFFKAVFSANFRAVIDMAMYDEPEKYPMYMSIDTGASQHPFSEHYFDMNDIHYSEEGRIMTLGIENARKEARYHLELVPAI
ncbi:unnamed protein product [Moneuplotes crassus]|uniref:Penicillin amidase n=1 Tax=Euplotes crassus TaxID=5936 RepID=A0AAD2D8M5_EUPCR|nr:unnamed protein product [Moneuplotes crassus]